jgi:hypothetical protein
MPECGVFQLVDRAQRVLRAIISASPASIFTQVSPRPVASVEESQHDLRLALPLHGLVMDVADNLYGDLCTVLVREGRRAVQRHVGIGIEYL